jgi:hypothetical protein
MMNNRGAKVLKMTACGGRRSGVRDVLATRLAVDG